MYIIEIFNLFRRLRILDISDISRIVILEMRKKNQIYSLYSDKIHRARSDDIYVHN